MDNNKNRRGKPGRLLIIFLVLCYASLSALPGCSPKIIERVVYQRDTTIVNHRDSVFYHDSVYVKEYVKGDTVYVEKYKDRYLYKDKWHDRYIYKEFHDTTTVTVEKKVEKELTAGQKMKINSFWWLLAGLAAALVWIFRKPIINLIKTLI